MNVGDLVGGRFRLEHAVGTGGMGDVWRARDEAAGGTVALKILHKEGEADIERFAREAALLAELDHPGIVHYVSHGADDGGLRWLAMEWLDGETLGERLLRGRLGAREAVDVTRWAAEALGAAHARGVVHRDVKPTNLFLVAGGGVKVLDFGVARRARERGGPTKTGVMIGSAGYMAPEQVRGLRGVDARVDVFALGCVLYECLVGRPAFAGDDPLAMLSRMLLEPPPSPASGSDELDALVARMLAQAPSERPGSGEEVARALAALRVADERPPSASVITSAERRLSRTLQHSAPSDAPFVGRERELAALEAWAEEVREEAATRWVRVIGPAGIGKTRLVRELVKRRPDVVFADERSPGGEPVLVVATARESVADARWQELRLAPLLRKASERLATHLLGARATPEAIARLCERAAGNARHLELLAAAGEDAPEALLAEVQAELDALPPAARRLLRAASVLGRQFSRDGLVALAGADAVATFLDDLLACEVLEKAGEGELAFRRPLVWEAARATLTDDDRALAEQLAERWHASRAGG